MTKTYITTYGLPTTYPDGTPYQRPEWVTCALTGKYTNDKPEQITWCGRKIVAEFVFQDATHALLNALNKGRLVLCDQCGFAMQELLEQQYEINSCWTNQEMVYEIDDEIQEAKLISVSYDERETDEDQ